MEREKLKSRLGFILLSAGCAIGIGNVWKFPYIAGQGGGGAFVLFYLIFLIILGLPIMTMEFAVGRASRKSPVRAYQALEKPGQKWHIHGYLTLIGCYLLMMFYTTVAGWMLHYFYMTATGKLAGLNADQVAGKFTEMLADPGVMTFWMVFVVALGIFVCAKGLQNGLERVTKVMMIALLVIMVVLAVNSLFMPGAKEGLSFFLVPDFGRMKEVGVVNTLVSAMNQAFFTLSLGIGAMSIFGSYIGKEHSLLGESARIVVLDTFVAITAGLIIFPACFTYGVDQTSGPSLIFITLPNIFANMAMGRLWGSLFFLFMAFAALSTVLAVRPNGMKLTKVSVPFGVIGIIYEARPNVTLDVFALCFKSGNACILKGGSDADFSNRILVEIIRNTLLDVAHLSPYLVALLPAGHDSADALLHARGYVDLIIPRGGKGLIDYVRQNATIPVIETGAGVCHVYFDKEGDVAKGAAIIRNAKTRRVSVCNALDCLIVDVNRLTDLSTLCSGLQQDNVEIYADDLCYNYLKTSYPSHLLKHASTDTFGTEFLDYKMAVTATMTIQAAVAHISIYGSGHSECIVTENDRAADYFMKMVDAACVYVNVPTSFTDGGEFGLGAEIGISTQKLHARGPMGLEELNTYKWIIQGDGQIRQ